MTRRRNRAAARQAVLCAAALGILVAGPSGPHAFQDGGPAQAPPAADPAQDTQEPPAFRGRVDLVRVDVMVTDGDGRPVTDLTQADFEVLEEGKPQQIEQFRIVNLSDASPASATPAPSVIRSLADEEVAAAQEDTRLFAFFLDEYHVRRNNAVAIRAPLRRFIETELRPTDMIAVMHPLTPISDVQFTRDHDRVLGAIQQFDGRKYDYTPRNQYEMNASRASTQDIERIRNAVVIDALTALSMRMGGLREGRKTIVFVSEGFTTLLPAELRRPEGLALAAPDPRFTAAQAGVDEELATISSETELYRRMQDVFVAASRYNTSIYSLDPRGTAVFEFQSGDTGTGTLPSQEADRRVLRTTQDSLRRLSEETHGRAIVNRNSFDEGLAQMALDSSAYYLLGYATGVPADGKFHRISVRVNRRGVDVRARPGFWAASEADVRRMAEPTGPEVAAPVQQALASIAPAPRGQRYVETWVGVAPGDGGRPQVRLVWEPTAPVPGERRQPIERVELVARAASGEEVFRGPVPDAAAASNAAAPPAGPRQTLFDAPPGVVELRITVHADGSTVDEETQTIEVPDPSAPDVRLSTPRVHRGRTARDIQGIRADAAAVPIAVRQFARTERLLIRFDVYGPGGSTPKTTAALLNRAGQKMVDLPVSEATAGGTHQIDLGLSGVPTGEYLVEITATGENGSATQLVPFRIS